MDHSAAQLSVPTPARDRIVVGVDDAFDPSAAVLWAAHEAQLRHCSLIISAVDAHPARIDGSRAAALRRRRLLDVTATAASQLQPGVAVATMVLCGAVSEQLIALSRTSALLVVGVDRSRGRPTEGAVGQVQDRVATQSRCPVVVVPFVPRADAARLAHVVVGCTEDAEGRDTLELAVLEAERRGASLSVVSVADEHQGHDADSGSRRDLELSIAVLGSTHPEVRIALEHSRGPGMAVLLRAAESADLVVLRGRRSRDRWSTAIGALAGQMLRRASCATLLIGSATGDLPNAQLVTTSPDLLASTPPVSWAWG